MESLLSLFRIRSGVEALFNRVLWDSPFCTLRDRVLINYSCVSSSRIFSTYLSVFTICNKILWARSPAYRVGITEDGGYVRIEIKLEAAYFK